MMIPDDIVVAMVERWFGDNWRINYDEDDREGHVATMRASLEEALQGPKAKVELVEGLGFTPVGYDHDRDCPANLGNGYVCSCAGEPTVWQAPQDVAEFRGETWEQRLAARRAQHGGGPIHGLI